MAETPTLSSPGEARNDARIASLDSKPGMGAIPHADGVAFRVWAPHADSVSVIGTFNDWKEDSHMMRAEGNGQWYVVVHTANLGDE